MKLSILLSFALCALSQAHMGMTLGGKPAREKAVHGDNYRSPFGTKICQGTPKVAVQKTVAVGDSIAGKMSGGAAHGGGHCSMLVSVDEKMWYKIGDYKDCTTKGGLQFKMPKGVPKQCSEPAGCTFGWLWTPIFSGTCEIYMNCYQLQVTGAMGGIETAANRKLQLPIGKCVRPNSKTRYSTMFGFIIGNNAADPYTEAAPPPAPGAGPAPAPVVVTPAPGPVVDNSPITVSPDTGSPTCGAGQLLISTGLPKTHKVGVEGCGYVSASFPGDAVKTAADEKKKCLEATTLSTISFLYDLQCNTPGCKKWDAIYNINKCTDKTIVHSCLNGNKPTCMAASPDLICLGQELKLPQSFCGEAPCGANGKWDAPTQTCFCRPGFTGAQCQIGSDGAVAVTTTTLGPLSCGDNGKWDAATKTCFCRPGYTGTQCQIGPGGVGPGGVVAGSVATSIARSVVGCAMVMGATLF